MLIARAVPVVWVLLFGLVATGNAQESRSTGATTRPASKGTLIALAKKNDTAGLIDLSTGEMVDQLPMGPNPNEVAVAPNQKRAVVSNMGHGKGNPGKTLTVIDIAKAEVVKTIDLGKDGAPHGVVWLDDRRILGTSHATDSLIVVDIDAGTVLASIPTGQKGTHLVCPTRDGKRAYAVNAFSGSIVAVDLAEKKVIGTVACAERAEGISLSPDEKTIAVGNVGAHTITIIDAEKLTVQKTIEDIEAPIRTCFSPDGKTLMVSSLSGEIVCYAVKDWTVERRVDLAKQKVEVPLGGQKAPLPMNFAISSDRRSAFVVLVASDAVAELDLATWEVTRLLKTGPLPDGIAVSTTVVK